MTLDPPRFYPMQLVTVTYLGLNLPGRVQHAALCKSGWVYSVEYNQDGEIHARDFYEDELEDRG